MGPCCGSSRRRRRHAAEWDPAATAAEPIRNDSSRFGFRVGRSVRLQPDFPTVRLTTFAKAPIVAGASAKAEDGRRHSPSLPPGFHSNVTCRSRNGEDFPLSAKDGTVRRRAGRWRHGRRRWPESTHARVCQTLPAPGGRDPRRGTPEGADAGGDERRPDAVVAEGRWPAPGAGIRDTAPPRRLRLSTSSGRKAAPWWWNPPCGMPLSRDRWARCMVARQTPCRRP